MAKSTFSSRFAPYESREHRNLAEVLSLGIKIKSNSTLKAHFRKIKIRNQI